MTIRNELLEQICIAYGGVTEGVVTMDGYLLCIANAVGADVRYPHIRNFLLEDILKVFNPAYFLEDYLAEPEVYMEAG